MAQVIVHPRAFRGPGSVMKLLRLALRCRCEVCSSRRGHLVLVQRPRSPLSTPDSRLHSA